MDENPTRISPQLDGRVPAPSALPAEGRERAPSQLDGSLDGRGGARASTGLTRRQLLEGVVASVACMGFLTVPAPAHAVTSDSDDVADEDVGTVAETVDDADDGSESAESSGEEDSSSVLGTSVSLMFFIVMFAIIGIIRSGGGRAEEDEGLNDWYKEHDDDRPWSRRG